MGTLQNRVPCLCTASSSSFSCTVPTGGGKVHSQEVTLKVKSATRILQGKEEGRLEEHKDQEYSGASAI